MINRAFLQLGEIPIWTAFHDGCLRGIESGSRRSTRVRFHGVDAFRKDGENVPLQPRNGVIQSEDPGTVRGLDGDFGGMKHIQETLLIRVDVNTAIIGANIKGRRATGKNATGRGAQLD